jgi:5-methylcytosine-specific restriction endonuclease McrA
MPIMRACLDCSVIVSASERRCPDHALAWNRTHRSRTVRRRSPAWDRLSRQMRAEHRRTVGPWCPGLPPDHDAHPSWDLTLDHIVSLDDGGTDDRSNARVLCREINSRRGGGLSRGGVG